MVNVWWYLGQRAFWDHGLLLAAFSGELYPTSLQFKEYLECPPTDEGAIIVVPGNVARDKGIEPIQRFIEKAPWAIVIHVSDEELAFDSNVFKSPKCKVWLQQIRPPEASPIALGDRNILLGWIEGTRETLEKLPRLPLKDRPYRWAYSGQVNNTIRDECAEELVNINRGMYGNAWRGRFLFTDGFGRGMERAEHLRWLSEAAIVPCPSGSYTIETFRLYETLESSAVPLPNIYAPRWNRTDLDFWKWFFKGGEPPFPTIRHWSEIHSIITAYRDDPIKLQSDANRCQSFWQQYKRSFVLAMTTDVSELVSKFGSQKEKDGLGELTDTWKVASESLANLPFIL